MKPPGRESFRLLYLKTCPTTLFAWQSGTFLAVLPSPFMPTI